LFFNLIFALFEMTYIASNGELYEDEEIFDMKDIEDEIEDEDYNFMSVDDNIMNWERKMEI
jgi:hypothetical protein